MVTLGSIQPASFQGFHVPGPQQYDDALSLQSLQLALDDAASSMPTSSPGTANSTSNQCTTSVPASGTPAETMVLKKKLAPTPPSRRGSVSLISGSDRSLGSPGDGKQADRTRLPRTSTYTASSASHRLFRQAKPESARSWHQSHSSIDNDGLPGADKSRDGELEGAISPASWHRSDNKANNSTSSTSSSNVVSQPPGLSIPSQQQQHQHQQEHDSSWRFSASNRNPALMSHRIPHDTSRPPNEVSHGD